VDCGHALDGRYLVSGSADQTVRLWNLQTHELIVTIFRGENGEWVIWTPQGYYMGSPGADKIIGWQINKGPNKAADYVTAEQLPQVFEPPRHRRQGHRARFRRRSRAHILRYRV
jgi:hypothetical protein